MPRVREACVSDACQINDFDHHDSRGSCRLAVSDACQINDFDHSFGITDNGTRVSDACQINDFDHDGDTSIDSRDSFRCLSD